MSGKAKSRLLLLLLMAGLCGYVGFLMFKERDPMPLYDQAVKLVKTEGPELERAKQYKAAADKYDQANLLFEHVLKRLNGPHGLDLEKMKEISGKTLSLKAVAIRDKHFCLAAAAGKPLEETIDTATGKSYRNVLSIPDAKDREEAAANLRGAAIHFLGKDSEALTEVLRLELMSSPMHWESIEKYAKQILDVKPDDTRAKYLIARYQFEQPALGSNLPAPSNKRSAERIKEALRLIDEVRQDPNFPKWRAEFLKAQIHRWYLWHYEGKQEKAYFDEMEILDKLLLDEVTGATSRIRQGESLNNLSRWDAEGVVGLHGLASDIALEIIRKKKLHDHSSLSRVYQDTLALCEAKLDAKDTALSRTMLLGTLLNVMSKSQTVLSTQDKTAWQKGLDFLRPELRIEFDRERVEPHQVAQFAELLMRESFLRRSDAKKREDLRQEAKKWLDDGLKFGKTHNLTSRQMLMFNLLASNVIYFTAGSREEITPFLSALQESRNPMAQATFLVIDGAYDEFEGRLEKARFKFEQALRIPGGEEEIRAHSALANVYLAMGMPDHALVSLGWLQGVFDNFNNLTNLEKEWVAQFLRSPQDYYSLYVTTILDKAKQDLAKYFRANPRAKQIPFDLVKNDEDRVRRILSRELPASVNAGVAARVAYCNYLLGTNRRDQAETIYDQLNRDFQDRFEVLGLRVSLKQAELREGKEPGKIKQIPEAVDKIILEHIKRNPQDTTAKLYLAMWQSQTGRTEQALAHLKDMSQATDMTPEMRKVIAAVVMSHNTNASPLKLLRHLPRDPQVDQVLLDLGRSVEKQQQDVRHALVRHETVALSRVMKAEDDLQKGDYKKAVEAFSYLLDFYRTKSLAQQGILRAMIGFAGKDADEALVVNRQLIADYPKEPIFYLTAAIIFQTLEDVGSPTDDWNLRRSMGSALNEWERALVNTVSANTANIALTRAEFWYFANRIDVARTEMQRALNNDRQNPAVLATCAYMILNDASHEPRPELREYVDDLMRLAPQLANTHHMAARVEEFERNWKKAISLYESALTKFPKDQQSYVRLLDLLDQVQDYDKGLEWARAWRKELPMDLNGIVAEIRFLCRKNDVAAASRAGDVFVAEAVRLATVASETIKEADPKLQAERRKKYIEGARSLAELDIARGYYIGGALDEADRRFHKLPKAWQEAPLSQEILGEILVRRKEWEKAEEVFERLFRADRRNLQAANNLIFLLATQRNRPERAREVLREALKGRKQSNSIVGAERLPPSFLSTISTVYVKLARPELAREMLDFFRPALQRYPNDPRVQLAMGYGMELSGEYGRAEDFYRNALRNSAHPALSENERINVVRDAESYLERLNQKRRNEAVAGPG